MATVVVRMLGSTLMSAVAIDKIITVEGLPFLHANVRNACTKAPTVGEEATIF